MKIESNEQYFEVSFDKQVLLALNISDSEFEDCEFNDCDFSSAVFARCKFLNCSFNCCNLSLIKIPYSRFFEVSFAECKLLGIDWTRAYWPSFHLDSELKFSKCILNDSSFFGLTLNELKFDQCKLHEVDLRDGDFSNSSMIYCDFTNSLFMHTNLHNVDFSESTNFNIDVLENKISKAKFSRFEALSLLSSLDIDLVD
ncbi:pentapeptide repeat-containing protein [Psychromonas sp.]|uniref:pentapeptide repeat-containing protein n=1 Tax=Psychromonas sp. TaxID=1884585 RepID=UPI0039E5CE7D